MTSPSSLSENVFLLFAMQNTPTKLLQKVPVKIYGKDRSTSCTGKAKMVAEENGGGERRGDSSLTQKKGGGGRRAGSTLQVLVSCLSLRHSGRKIRSVAMVICRTGSIHKTTGARHADLAGGCLFSHQVPPFLRAPPSQAPPPLQGAESENGWLGLSPGSRRED